MIEIFYPYIYFHILFLLFQVPLVIVFQSRDESQSHLFPRGCSLIRRRILILGLNPPQSSSLTHRNFALHNVRGEGPTKRLPG